MRTPLYLDFANGQISEQTTSDLEDSFQPVLTTITTTTNASETIATITPPSYARGFLLIYVCGSKDDGSEGIIGAKMIHWKTSAGTATIVSSTNIIADSLDSLTTATWAVDASAGTIRIRVTGETSKNINWSCIYKILTVETTALP